jgi:urate oxidase
MPLHVARRAITLTGLSLLGVVRRGDRHTVRDLEAAIAIEPGTHRVDVERLRNTVQSLAPIGADVALEMFALELARHVAADVQDARHVDVTVTEQAWHRLDIGGRARNSDFSGSAAERRTGRATLNDAVETTHAGLHGLSLLSTRTDSPIFARLDAEWTYGWTDVPHDTQWQQVRRALMEGYTERDLEPGIDLAAALGGTVLDESPAVRAIEIRLCVHRLAGADAHDAGRAPRATVFTAAVARDEID